MSASIGSRVSHGDRDLAGIVRHGGVLLPEYIGGENGVFQRLGEDGAIARKREGAREGRAAASHGRTDAWIGHNMPGAKLWRRRLSEESRDAGARPLLFRAIWEAVCAAGDAA